MNKRKFKLFEHQKIESDCIISHPSKSTLELKIPKRTKRKRVLSESVVHVGKKTCKGKSKISKEHILPLKFSTLVQDSTLKKKDCKTYILFNEMLAINTTIKNTDVKKTDVKNKYNEDMLNNYDVKKISLLISKILNKHIKLNNNKIIDEQITSMKSNECLKKFILDYIPSISVYEYATRCVKYFKCEKSCHICAFIYMDRLMKDSGIYINKYNYHIIYGIALVCSCKYNEDIVFTNEYYAKVMGISLDDINKIEHIFLRYIKYDLYITTQLFNEYSTALETSGST